MSALREQAEKEAATTVPVRGARSERLVRVVRLVQRDSRSLVRGAQSERR